MKMLIRGKSNHLIRLTFNRVTLWDYPLVSSHPNLERVLVKPVDKNIHFLISYLNRVTLPATF